MFLAVGACSPFPAMADAMEDPLQSSVWPYMRRQYASDAAVTFDPRVEVLTPRIAEDSLSVPVTVRVRDVPDVERIVVIADLNPIVKILEYEPRRSLPTLSFRIKLQQASPVRALVRRRGGTWLAGGQWVDAAGGGCTAPSTGRTAPDWTLTLNAVQGRVWREDGRQRLRLRIRHPMDTGLAPGIPAFYIEEISVLDRNAEPLFQLATFEPVSENPVFSFDLPNTGDGPLRIVGRDNNGNRIEAAVQP